MQRHLQLAALIAACTLATQAMAVTPVVFPLFTEDFSGATLGDSVNERDGFPIVTVPAIPDPNTSDPVPGVFSASGPAGWTVDKNFTAFGNIDLAYDGKSLGDPNVVDVDEGIAPTVGTIIGNAGLLNQGEVDHGSDDFEGWTFLDKDFWVEAAEDQNRSSWTGGTGTVAVIDPDEYDDLGDGRGGGYINSGLTMPNVAIGSNTLMPISFDYSFSAEGFDDSHDPNGGSVLGGLELNNQTAQVYVTYRDNSNAIIQTDTLSGTLIDSDAGRNLGDPNADDYRPASPTLATAGDIDGSFFGFIPLPGSGGPAGATSFEVTFGLLNAGNDWWYAIDNVLLQGNADGVIINEGFEGVTLGDSVNEQRATVPQKVTAANNDGNTSPHPDAFTHTAPGWTVDNSATPADTLGDNNIGVLEWEGWSFTTLDFWTFADTQQRELFTKCVGNCAVADGDEWDDLNDPTDPNFYDPNGAVVGHGGLMNTLMTSDPIDITGVGAGELFMTFDSSWRDEDDNTAVITVDYGSGPVEVLRWSSDDQDANFHDDNPNETVTIPLNNPGGATTATIALQYIGGNDWWWAVDNIQIGTIPEPTSISLSLLGVLGLGVTRRRKK